MPTPSTEQHNPPKDWDEFENICADLFSHEWGDRNATRYGRQGQRQNGVDIYGYLSDGNLVGVQCKGRRAWPPKKLTNTNIDREVREAKKFQPPLTEFTIATIAPDDVKGQDHARKITERHKKKGLFRVHVVGWGEIIRRLTQHHELVDKHYHSSAVLTIKNELQAVPDATAKAVFELVGNTLQPGLSSALERDLDHRYNRALHRALFPETHKVDEFSLLANEILDRQYSSVSRPLRRRILLRAARSASLRSNVAEGERFLTAATALDGPDSDRPARARLAEGRGDIDGAIRLLRDETDVDARSTLFSVLARHHGEAAALAWLAEHKLSVPDLTANGIYTLAMIHLEHDHIERMRDVLIEATSAQLIEAPYLLFLRAGVCLGALFPKPEQRLPLMGVPLDVRSGHTVPEAKVVMAELDSAIADLNQFLPVADGLGLHEARRIASGHMTWCHLLHPFRCSAAVARLRAEMESPATALSQLQFALAHDSEFDPKPIARYLESREHLGGLNDEELRAVLVLHLHVDEPRILANYIARYRAQLENAVGKVGISSIEIQALALAGDTTSARLALIQNRNSIDTNRIQLLEANIAKAEGADPVAEFKRAYGSTMRPEALRAFIDELMKRKEHRAVAQYAEELYTQTNDPRDAAIAANAYANAGNGSEFLRIVDSYPFVKNLNPSLARRQAWLLFEFGRLSEAKQISDKLRIDHEAKYRDINLEIAIAVESGDWDTLAAPLGAYLENVSEHSGVDLMRAAQISQASGQGSFERLVNAAVERAPDSPNVLIGAYSMVLEEGLEEKTPDASLWFRRALDLSGPSGPVKQFELKELLAQQVAWNTRIHEVSDAVIKGDLPLIGVAVSLRTTLVDVILRNLLRNSTLTDPRKRIALPLYSGRRKPSSIRDVSRLAVDQSALMVLAWLGLLPKVFEAYSEIMLPAGTLQELFEARSRIRSFQKSRVARAREIRSAIARAPRQLKVHRSVIAPNDPLVRKFGSELASLLMAARAVDGVVIRPAPVLGQSLEVLGDDELTAFKDIFVDTHWVLAALREHGAIDHATEEVADHYFKIQDKGWPSPPGISTTRTIFLDGVAVAYLQYVNLLEVVLENFESVFIDASTEEEASALIDHAKNADEALRIIDEIRVAVHKAYASRKLIFGPVRRTPHGGDHEQDVEGVTTQSSTLNLFSSLMKSDAVVVDDRAINKEPIVIEKQGQRARLVNSLDIIEDLTERNVISESERRALRHRLRTAGAVLVPVDTEEIVEASLRIRQKESAEFRSIRNSIGLARVAEVPRFPSEIPWFLSVSTSVQHALIQVWAREKDTMRSAQISETLLDLCLRPDEWITRWEGRPPPEWSLAVSTIMTAGLATPIELTAEEAVSEYNNWLQNRVLTPLRNSAPEHYRRVAENIRSIILDESPRKTKRPQKLLRLRALLVLKKLPEMLRSEVLSDGRVSARYGLNVSRPIHLLEKLVVNREVLFSAFRDAANGVAPQSLVDQDGAKLDSKVSIDNDDSGIVEIGHHRLRFHHAALMSDQRDHRLEVVQRALSELSLTVSHSLELMSLVGQPAFSFDNFLDAVNSLSSAPETFAEFLREKVTKGRVSEVDLLPDDVRHWENLTAEKVRSTELRGFVSDELKVERVARIEKDAVQGFRSISLTFSAPELVPHELLREMDADTVFRMIEGIKDVDDPFALAGAFEICTDWISKYPRFIELGERLLDSLFADLIRLQHFCGMFAAAWVIATAQLATHETTRQRPVYWRRLAAASHAALVVRTCGASDIDHEELLSWVMGRCGLKYSLSVYRDMVVEPQWRPEWAHSNFLAADVFGRIYAAITNLAQGDAPTSWHEKIESAKSWIIEQNLSPLTMFPAVLQGARRAHTPTLTELDTPAADIWLGLKDAPSADTLLRIASLIQCFGAPPGVNQSVFEALRKIRDGADSFDSHVIQAAITTAAHVAVLTNDVGLSEFVADTCVEKARSVTTEQAVHAIVFRLVECAAASTDRTTTLHGLAERLEAIAFNLPSGELSSELVRSLKALVQVEPDIAPLLGRTIHAARLAASRTSV